MPSRRSARSQTKHQWLLEELRKLIGELPVGTALPPQRSLALDFGVARMTLRQAFDVLERNGEVEQRERSGTFAARPKLEQQLKITSFTADMERLGLRASTLSLGGSVVPAGKSRALRLGIDPDDEIWNMGRLRLADGEPIAIERVSVPVLVAPGIESEDLQGDSLYRIFQETFGIKLAGGRQRMEATITDEEDSELLQVPVRSPALFVDRVVWDSNLSIVEHVEAIYRGDRYVFTTALQLE